MNLLAAAEAAEGDGFLMSFFADKIGIADTHELAAILLAFRNWRETYSKEQP